MMFPNLLPANDLERLQRFACRVCGVQCPVAPPLPGRAVCEEHCEDHDYQYERWFRQHRCIHCDKPAPDDWFDCQMIEKAVETIAAEKKSEDEFFKAREQR